MRVSAAVLCCLIVLAGLVLLVVAPRDLVNAPWLDYVASAYNQLGLGLLLAAGVAAGLLRRWRRPIPVALVLLVWFGQIRLLPAAPGLSRDDSPRYILLSLNAQGDARNAEKVRALIRRVDPDIICLQEASGDKKSLGGEFLDAYPYQLKSQPGFRWFTTLLSRHPILPVDQAPRRVMAKYEEGSLQSAVVETPGGSILVGTCHLIRGPEHVAIWEAGNRAAFEVAAHLAATAEALGVPAVLAGDLNGGPFSRRGRNVRAAGPWRLAHRPYPWLGTWPSSLPGVLRVQPDQVYLTPGMGVVSCRVGGSVGSDHRPIIVEFGFRR